MRFMKLAIALAGGGSKGSYQVGFWKALRELGIAFDIVTGTSIGAVNGALMVQNDFDKAVRLWKTATAETIMNHGINLTNDIDYYFEHRDQLLSFAKDYASCRGADITPYREKLDADLNEAAFFASPVDYALMTVRFPSMQPVEVRKADIAPGYLPKWVLASSSCFPAFPLCDIDGQTYIDGGYVDNLPISAAFRLGAERVIAVGLKPGVSEKKYTRHPLVTYIEPSRPLGMFLDFDRETLDRNFELGYVDTMRVLGRYFGKTYAFRPEGKALLERAAQQYLLWLLQRELSPADSAVGVMVERFAGETPLSDRILQNQSGGLLECACTGLECLLETLGYPREQAYDLHTLLPELHAALLSETPNPALEQARELCATLGKDHLIAQITPVVPMYDAQELFLATLLLYVQERAE